MREVKKPTNSMETRKIRKILNEEARLGISPNSDSEAEEVDLTKELYPLGHYINNREEMIEQMFSIIKGTKLTKMLPPILKDMPFDELKADCLIHLLGMSKKRIRAILEGKEIYSSSDSESHSDGSTTPNKKPKMHKPFVIKQEGCSDISDNSEEVVLVDPDLEFSKVPSYSAKLNTMQAKKNSKRKLKRRDLDKKPKTTKTKPKEETSESDEVLRIDSSAESASGIEAETEAPKEGKTLLEILELEMRARAIRALLKSNEPQEDEGQTANEDPNQNPSNSKDKSKKHVEEDTTKKVTPAKNFRKKKRKSDDVIIITPKVVTIDLTDENEHSATKTNSETNTEDNVPSSSQNNNSPKTRCEANKISMSEDIPVLSEQLSKTDLEISCDKAATCTVERSSNNESVKTAEPDDKSSWAQRWLDSKEVKKVVSTSKICGNIRKKIKSARLARKQKPPEDKPEILLPVIQKEVEGSVVEYEMLSKSNTMAGNDVDGVINNDSQTSLTQSQEPTFLEDELNQPSTADQVQDVSSTRVENILTTSGIQVNEEIELVTNLEVDTCSVVITTKGNFNNEDTDVPFTAEDGKKRNGSIDSIEVSNIFQNQEGNENIIDCKEIEDDHPKYSQKALPDSEVPNDQSNTDGFHGVICDDISDSKDCDSPSSCPDEADSCLSVINSDEKDEFDTSKDISDQNQEKNVSSKIETKNFEKAYKEISISEVSDTLNDIVSVCNAKPSQEQIEPETLEINITDEDRDIEAAIEDTDGKNTLPICKESIIVID